MQRSNNIHLINATSNNTSDDNNNNKVNSTYYNNNHNSNSNSSKFTVMAFNSSTVFIRQSMPKLILSLLLLQWVSRGIKPVDAGAVAVAVNESVVAPAQSGDHCVVVLENAQVLKQVGAVWVSPKDPCAIHACEVDEAGRAHETITAENCGQFYCDVDSELRPDEGTCCGACVRTKCRFNDDIYEVGRTWHNQADCTLLECAQLPNGQLIINAYQKTCPPMPTDCPPERVYTEDCCQYCKKIATVQRSINSSDVEDTWTEEYYRNHPCVRECQANEPPKMCYYKFVVEWYHTLSKACYGCPQNGTDCSRPHCIAGDGIPRSVTVVNRMMPGPSIEVCFNDHVVVDVKNDLLGESTTIHWHGLHQKENPYMDGVPHISQCPISPHATFRYSFRADNVGTHFWHSHTGMQRGDGVFGAFIVRRPRTADPHAHLYDFDLSEHKMLVQDWVHVPGISMFADHHHSRGDNKPTNLLINGHGRYYTAIWESIKAEQRQQTPRIAAPKAAAAAGTTAKPDTAEFVPVTLTPKKYDVESTTSTPYTEVAEDTTLSSQQGLDDIDYLHPLENAGRINLRQGNDISRLARLVKTNEQQLTTNGQLVSGSNDDPQMQTTTATTPTTTAGATESLIASNASERSNPSTENESVKPVRFRRTAGDYNVSLDEIPLQVYTVRQGFRYRFRIINAEFLNCPIALSVDNHTLTAINSDGYDFEAVEVGSIVTYAGERFDFVLHANQSLGSYWVRLKGLMDCSEAFTSAFQVAILRYEGAPENVHPNGELGYGHKAPGIQLNAMNRGSGYVDSLTIAELNGLPQYDLVPGVDRDALKPVADYKFFVYYDFYAKDNPSFHPADYYGFNDSVSASNRLFTPQLNHISLKFPSVALLPMRDQVDETTFCNDTSLAAQGIDCREQFCKCHHVLQVPLGSVVEFIIVDEGATFDANHPFHLHGNAFRVVALERLGSNVTVEMVKQLDHYNLLKRNLVRPPIKDTVTVPDGGYTIVRFEAYNPGFWLFHCHIEFHAEIGMALILKVGDNDEMVPVPPHFPTCHDYMPEPTSGNAGASGSSTPSDSHTTAAPPGGSSDKNSGAALWRKSDLLLPLLLLLSVASQLPLRR